MIVLSVPLLYPDAASVRERRPGGKIGDSDRNARRRSFADIIESPEKNIEHAAEQIDMSGRGCRRGILHCLCGICADRQEQQDRDPLSLAVDATMTG